MYISIAHTESVHSDLLHAPKHYKVHTKTHKFCQHTHKVQLMPSLNHTTVNLCAQRVHTGMPTVLTPSKKAGYLGLRVLSLSHIELEKNQWVWASSEGAGNISTEKELLHVEIIQTSPVHPSSEALPLLWTPRCLQKPTRWSVSRWTELLDIQAKSTKQQVSVT